MKKHINCFSQDKFSIKKYNRFFKCCIAAGSNIVLMQKGPHQ